MAINKEKYLELMNELGPDVTLVAVSKTKPVEDIRKLYALGHRDFGENYVQELVDKESQLPKDIRWHFIGHLQSNKVKYIAPFVHLVHGVDSLKLLTEINKQAAKNKRVINCLLQVHIAQEETKFGLDEAELSLIINEFQNLEFTSLRICGLMGMASFTDDMSKVRKEFQYLKTIFDKYAVPPVVNLPADRAGCQLAILSMGMSSDYAIAVEEGSNMVRIGSLIFGARDYEE